MMSRTKYGPGAIMMLAGLMAASVAGGAAIATNRPAESVEQYTGYYPIVKFFDQATLVKEWRAPRLPNTPADRQGEVIPVIRERDGKLTGKNRAAAAVVRSSANSPVFQLDFGSLPVSCYVVRIIGLVRTAEIDTYRKPLCLELTVQGPDGVAQFYRQRAPYWDDFYAVGEIYFNVDQPGPWSGRFTLGKGSLVDLQIQAIELHDTLKGLAGKAGKTRPGLFTLEERAQLRKNSDPAAVRRSVLSTIPSRKLDPYLAATGRAELSATERQKRDQQIWEAFPPLNSQVTGIWFPTAFPGQAITAPAAVDLKALAEQHGQWEWQANGSDWLEPLALVNKKLGREYTASDFRQRRPLPDPYPIKDDGTAFYIPKNGKLAHADNFALLGTFLHTRWRMLIDLLGPTDGDDAVHRLPYLYHAAADRAAARDAALLLCKWAYIYPAFTDAMVLDGALVAPAGMYQRDLRLMQRYPNMAFGGLYSGLLTAYDYLFDFINGNQELAAAVGRFIPWVKTDADVRRLIETRVLQYGARQIMTFHNANDKDTPGLLMETAAVQQDQAITRPWLDYLWSRTWIYPHARAGLPDYISTTTQRDGTTDIGSVFYAWNGSPFLPLALLTRRYVQNGGDPQFDLTDPNRYRKNVEACAFPLDSAVAGGFPLTIGDVGGPAKPRLFAMIKSFEDNFRQGWRLGQDPRCAWLTRHYFGRADETDTEWAALEQAAERQGRNPFLSQKSRVLANWAGILESGTDADDFRFKRTVMLRVGTGVGHAHADTLDLQMMAHGVRVVNDVGWRPGYSAPHATFSQVHNLVEVDEKNWEGHAWISAFAPQPGAQYLQAVSAPVLPGVRLRTREVALIDVDDGIPGKTEPAPLPYTDQTRFDPAAQTPNSYVFDVQRVAGGSLHTWCFHGTLSDQFQVNLAGQTPRLDDAGKQYLRRYLQGESLKYAGDTPALLTADWQLRRNAEIIEALDRDGKPVKLTQPDAEALMLGAAFNPAAPRRHTRAHLLGQQGARALLAHISPNVSNTQETWPFLFVQQRGTDLESVFPAIIEPYVGTPFIKSVRCVAVPASEKDALRPVAVEVTLANGRKDFCFSDGYYKPRQVENFRVNGRFAFVSQDAQGLRQAALVEGTELVTPWGTLKLDAPARTAAVVKVDYWRRKVWLDQPWDVARLAGEQVEFGNAAHRTSYTVVAAAAEGKQTVLTLDKALDLSFAHVTKSDYTKQQVSVNVGPAGFGPGMNAGLTCTGNDPNKKQWKCQIVAADSSNYAYQLSDGFDEKDFPAGGIFRLWEFGAGDTARLACRAAVRRASDGSYKVEGNVPADWRKNR